MKTNHLLKAMTLTFSYSFFSTFPPATVAITDQQIIQGLEVVGDFEAAYPLAYQLAETQNTYATWREVATKYAQFDSDGKLYLHTWQQAQRVNTDATYRDFLTLRPTAALNLHTIHAIFKLVKTSDKVADYVHFMETFPNTVEAMEALLRVQELAFVRAKQANDPVIYDAFVTTFQGAKQVPEALQLALAAERKAVAEEEQNANYETHERLARRLFNEARLAEKEQNSLVAARRYALLTEERFQDTKVMTELLDREERLAFQKLMETKQTDIVNQIGKMQDAVVQTINVQTQYLGDTIVKELQTQGQQLEAVIATHNRVLTQQLQAINQNMDKLGRQQLVMGGAGLVVSALTGGLVYQGFSQTNQSLGELNQSVQESGKNNVIANIAGKVVSDVAKPVIESYLSNPGTTPTGGGSSFNLASVVSDVAKPVIESYLSNPGTTPTGGGSSFNIALDVVGCATASVGAVTTGGSAVVPAVWKCSKAIVHVVGPFIPSIKTWKFW